MVDTYYLVREKDNEIVAKFEMDADKSDHFAVFGACYVGISWYSGDREPCEYQFVADVYCKWDSCTHWYFNGECYYPESGDIDAYYHLCGPCTFVKHIRMMCFVWKLVASIMQSYGRNDVIDNYFEGETIQKLCALMLDGYTIEGTERKE